jgi:hypothetical protein
MFRFCWPFDILNIDICMEIQYVEKRYFQVKKKFSLKPAEVVENISDGKSSLMDFYRNIIISSLNQ